LVRKPSPSEQLKNPQNKGIFTCFDLRMLFFPPFLDQIVWKFYRKYHSARLELDAPEGII
jgi:hypothetical protein